jgi:asparagine synthase (glutamine-hydrolysing)
MCGITGVYLFNKEGQEILKNIEPATRSILHRGPDNQNTWGSNKIALGHSRLSIIDTSDASNQPFKDETGRFVIVFNGEIFNYKEIKSQLESKGIKFKTNGDVEVLLELFKLKKENALSELRGFFAAAIYDNESHKLWLIRDRFGVKPLYYYFDEDKLIFGSEIKTILCIENKARLNYGALGIYFQLNYFGGNQTVFEGVNKIPSGNYALVENGSFSIKEYYSLRKKIIDYSKTSHKETSLYSLLASSVKDRMIADVPVGSFISGGIDSTIITGLASQIKNDLSTFCLGFKNNSWFDESPYAEIAAKEFKTNHHTFMIDEDEMLSELDYFLDALDEPFADSSALNFYILSKKTKNHVKVVLSGDGADEIFGGYNKHRAAWLLKNSPKHKALSKISPFLKLIFPSSRNSALGNKMRQLDKFHKIGALDFKEQYWTMASISSAEELKDWFLNTEVLQRSAIKKNEILNDLRGDEGINGILLKDVELVLEGDMLVKADRMSMQHGLEIRNPFLDHRLVEWALTVPENQKLNGKEGKIILKNTFKNIIPEKLIHRSKHGFELPLHSWMKNQLRSKIENIYLSKDFIINQNIFNFEAIQKLKQKLFSNNPGDTPAKVWAIIVFNHWYMKNEKHIC